MLLHSWFSQQFSHNSGNRCISFPQNHESMHNPFNILLNKDLLKGIMNGHRNVNWYKVTLLYCTSLQADSIRNNFTQHIHFSLNYCKRVVSAFHYKIMQKKEIKLQLGNIMFNIISRINIS